MKWNDHSLFSQSVFDSLYDVHILELHFASGKADLTPESKLVLDSVLHYFAGISGEKSVRITAHTDSVGPLDFNEKLSARRAETVSKMNRRVEIKVTGRTEH